jgi:hypothetical protein
MGMAVDDRLECFGDVGGRVDVVELAGGDDRREQGPVFRADFMTGEERIFSGQADWPDGVLDRVRVKLEAPVKILVAGIAVVAALTPASANVLDVTVTGTVYSGGDTTADTYGLFGAVGSNLVGAQFTAVYSFDLTGAYFNSFGDGNGGFARNADYNNYPYSWSPNVSAVFTINNQSVTFAGAQTWEVYATPYRLIQDISQSNMYLTTFGISSTFSFPSTLNSSFGPLNVFSSPDSLFAYNGEYLDLNVSTMTQVSVSATPIPAALPLFASGLGGLGLLRWFRRRTARAV